MKTRYFLLVGIFAFLWLSLLAFDYNTYAWDGDKNDSITDDTVKVDKEYDDSFGFDINTITGGIVDKLDKIIDLVEELVELEYRKEEETQQQLETIETQLDNTYDALRKDENKIEISKDSENIDYEEMDPEETTESYQKNNEISPEETTTEYLKDSEQEETVDITLLDIHNDLLKLLVSVWAFAGMFLGSKLISRMFGNG